MAKKANEILQVGLRLRRGLSEKLHAEAKKNDCSVNTEIVNRLESSFDEQESALDFQKAISILSGSKENANLLSMISSALHLVTTTLRESKNRFEILSRTVQLIIRSHAGNPECLKARSDMDGMAGSEVFAFIMADTILRNRGFSGVIPPEENEKNWLSLADLATTSTSLADRDKFPTSLADLGKLMPGK